MSKKVTGQIKLQIVAGQATAAPPVGPALGQKGVNIGKFIQEFNSRTKSQSGTLLPVVITVYSDKSFTFITKTPPVSVLLKEAAKITKGSQTPRKETIGEVSESAIAQIAQTKLPDLNCYDLEAAEKMIIGSALSMGLKVKEGK